MNHNVGMAEWYQYNSYNNSSSSNNGNGNVQSSIVTSAVQNGNSGKLPLVSAGINQATWNNINFNAANCNNLQGQSSNVSRLIQPLSNVANRSNVQNIPSAPSVMEIQNCMDHYGSPYNTNSTVNCRNSSFGNFTEDMGYGRNQVPLNRLLNNIGGGQSNAATAVNVGGASGSGTGVRLASENVIRQEPRSEIGKGLSSGTGLEKRPIPVFGHGYDNIHGHSYGCNTGTGSLSRQLPKYVHGMESSKYPQSSQMGLQNGNIGSTRIPRTGLPSFFACKAFCCPSESNVRYQQWDKYQSMNQADAPQTSDNFGVANHHQSDGQQFAASNSMRKNVLDSPAQEWVGHCLSNVSHTEHAKSVNNHKYDKEAISSRNYTAPIENPHNLSDQSYMCMGDYKWAIKEYPKVSGANPIMNKGLVKQNSAPQKYPSKQDPYHNECLMSKGVSVLHNQNGPLLSAQSTPYLAPYKRNTHNQAQQEYNENLYGTNLLNVAQSETGNPQRHHEYQRKLAIQKFAIEKRLRELSKIPGYQSHSKYKECILRYKELLQIQSCTPYPSDIQQVSPVPQSGPILPPINLQFDQNGMLMNSSLNLQDLSNIQLPSAAGNQTSERVSARCKENSHEMFEQVKQLRTEQACSRNESVSLVDALPTESSFAQKPDNYANLTKESPNKSEERGTKDVASKPELDVRQFLANWDESQDEEAVMSNLANTDVSKSASVIVVSYEGVVALSPKDSPKILEASDNRKCANGEPAGNSEKNSEMEANTLSRVCQVNAYPVLEDTNTIGNITEAQRKEIIQSAAGSECLNKTAAQLAVVHAADTLKINCPADTINGKDGQMPCNKIAGAYYPAPVDANPMLKPFAAGPNGNPSNMAGACMQGTQDDTPADSNGSSDSSDSSGKQLPNTNSCQFDERNVTVNSTALQSLSSPRKGSDENRYTNVKKQTSLSDESHNPDDISLPDLPTSVCTPNSTALNTPTHSDSEMPLEKGSNLGTSVTPIGMNQNSADVSFTESATRLESYRDLYDANCGPLNSSTQQSNPQVRSQKSSNIILGLFRSKISRSKSEGDLSGPGNLISPQAEPFCSNLTSCRLPNSSMENQNTSDVETRDDTSPANEKGFADSIQLSKTMLVQKVPIDTAKDESLQAANRNCAKTTRNTNEEVISEEGSVHEEKNGREAYDAVGVKTHDSAATGGTEEYSPWTRRSFLVQDNIGIPKSSNDCRKNHSIQDRRAEQAVVNGMNNRNTSVACEQRFLSNCKKSIHCTSDCKPRSILAREDSSEAADPTDFENCQESETTHEPTDSPRLQNSDECNKVMKYLMRNGCIKDEIELAEEDRKQGKPVICSPSMQQQSGIEERPGSPAKARGNISENMNKVAELACKDGEEKLFENTSISSANKNAGEDIGERWQASGTAGSNRVDSESNMQDIDLELKSTDNEEGKCANCPDTRPEPKCLCVKQIYQACTPSVCLPLTTEPMGAECPEELPDTDHRRPTEYHRSCTSKCACSSVTSGSVENTAVCEKARQHGAYSDLLLENISTKVNKSLVDEKSNGIESAEETCIQVQKERNHDKRDRTVISSSLGFNENVFPSAKKSAEREICADVEEEDEIKKISAMRAKASSRKVESSEIKVGDMVETCVTTITDLLKTAECTAETNLKLHRRTLKSLGLVDLSSENVVRSSSGQYLNVRKNVESIPQPFHWDIENSHLNCTHDCERSLPSEKAEGFNSDTYRNTSGFANPVFAKVEKLDGFDKIPVYTTKDGKISYSPSRRFTYYKPLIEAYDREELLRKRKSFRLTAPSVSLHCTCSNFHETRKTLGYTTPCIKGKYFHFKEAHKSHCKRNYAFRSSVQKTVGDKMNSNKVQSVTTNRCANKNKDRCHTKLTDSSTAHTKIHRRNENHLSDLSDGSETEAKPRVLRKKNRAHISGNYDADDHTQITIDPPFNNTAKEDLVELEERRSEAENADDNFVASTSPEEIHIGKKQQAPCRGTGLSKSNGSELVCKTGKLSTASFNAATYTESDKSHRIRKESAKLIGEKGEIQGKQSESVHRAYSINLHNLSSSQVEKRLDEALKSDDFHVKSELKIETASRTSVSDSELNVMAEHSSRFLATEPKEDYVDEDTSRVYRRASTGIEKVPCGDNRTSNTWSNSSKTQINLDLSLARTVCNDDGKTKKNAAENTVPVAHEQVFNLVSNSVPRPVKNSDADTWLGNSDGRKDINSQVEAQDPNLALKKGQDGNIVDSCGSHPLIESQFSHENDDYPLSLDTAKRNQRKHLDTSKMPTKKLRRGVIDATRECSEEIGAAAKLDVRLQEGIASITMEKVPKVIIRRSDSGSEFKCEISKDDVPLLFKSAKWQPKVKLERLTSLDQLVKGSKQFRLNLLDIATSNSLVIVNTQGQIAKSSESIAGDPEGGPGFDIALNKCSNKDLNRQKRQSKFDTVVTSQNFDDSGTAVIKIESSDESQTTIEFLSASPDRSEVEVDVKSAVKSNESLQNHMLGGAMPTQLELELELRGNDIVENAWQTSKVSNCQRTAVRDNCNCTASPLLTLKRDIGKYNAEKTVNGSPGEQQSREQMAGCKKKSLELDEELINEILSAKKVLKKCLHQFNMSAKDSGIRSTAVEKQKCGGPRSEFHNNHRYQQQSTSNGTKGGDHLDDRKQISYGAYSSKNTALLHCEDKLLSNGATARSQSKNVRLGRMNAQDSSMRMCPPGTDTTESTTISLKSSKQVKAAFDDRNAAAIVSEEALFYWKQCPIEDAVGKGTARDVYPTCHHVNMEVRPKEDNMPVLQPEVTLNSDPSFDRDNSRSPPIITSQDDFEELKNIERNKVILAAHDTVDQMKDCQQDLEMSVADIVRQLAYEQKATLKHRRYCNLCAKWFPTTSRHIRHLAGYQHRHIEAMQRKSIHTLFILFTGKPCPKLPPPNVVRNDYSIGELTPLQIAVQDIANYMDSADQATGKDV